MELRQGFAGGCQVNGTGICVTKPETYCDTDTFWPAHYLRTPGNPLRYCTYSGIIENVIIGRCSSVGKNGNGGKCSNLQSRCDRNGNDNVRNRNLNGTTNEEEDDQSSLFIEYDPTCTITQDLSSSSSTSYVTYGKCDDRCVWSSEDCIKEEIYIPNDPSCTADKVQIGACFAGHAYCAVDAASCTTTQTNLNLPEEPFWTHQEVKAKLGVNCFLASLPTPPTESPPPPPPPTESPMLAVPTSGFAVFDEDGNPILVSSSNKNGGGGGGGLQTGALVAIVAVVAVVIGAVIGVGTVRLRNKRKDQHANNNAWKVNSTKQHTLPIEDIEIRNSNENMDNNNNDDDDHANSELSEENYHQIIMQQQK